MPTGHGIKLCFIKLFFFSFHSIFHSLITLYWSVFGMMPMTELHLPPEAVVAETSGSLLYASFYVLVIIVLLNALIAVWSNVYNEIEVQ